MSGTLGEAVAIFLWQRFTDIRDSNLVNPAPLGFRIWKHRSSGTPTAHAHLDVEFNYLTEGRLRYLMGGRSIEVPRRRMVLFWAGIPHLTTCIENASGIWGTLPIDWLLERPHLGPLSRHLLKGGWVRTPTALTAGEEELLSGWLADFESGKDARFQAMMLELEARLIRMQPALSGRSPAGVAEGERSQFERIAFVAVSSYQDPELSVAAMADDLNLHPKYLLRLFKKTAGITLWEYVTRLRLAHTHRLLLTTDRTVLDAAFDAGFGSSAAFYEARKRAGLTGRQNFRHH